MIFVTALSGKRERFGSRRLRGLRDLGRFSYRFVSFRVGSYLDLDGEYGRKGRLCDRKFGRAKYETQEIVVMNDLTVSSEAGVISSYLLLLLLLLLS